VDVDGLARFLESDERRRWENPTKIIKATGVKRGMTVADLACGPGFFTIPLATLVGEEGLVYAVDSSPTMLSRLRTNLEGSTAPRGAIRVVHADVAGTGIRASSVDFVFFANVLHDIVDKRAFFEEVKRISKPISIIADIDWKKTKTRHGPPLEIRLSAAESKKLLTDGGFAIVKSFEAGPHHYGLLCRPCGFDKLRRRE
jgi:ubiquinone/menaquinone biosynthesis C-methylase UbiE